MAKGKSPSYPLSNHSGFLFLILSITSLFTISTNLSPPFFLPGSTYDRIYQPRSFVLPFRESLWPFELTSRVIFSFLFVSYFAKLQASWFHLHSSVSLAYHVMFWDLHIDARERVQYLFCTCRTWGFLVIFYHLPFKDFLVFLCLSLSLLPRIGIVLFSYVFFLWLLL